MNEIQSVLDLISKYFYHSNDSCKITIKTTTCKHSIKNEMLNYNLKRTRILRRKKECL